MTRPCLTLTLLVLLLSLVVAGNCNGISLASHHNIRVTNSGSSMDSNMNRPEQFSDPNQPDLSNDSDNIDRLVLVDGPDKDAMLKAVEASLLNLFGLPSRPRPNRRVHIPHYMLSLYHQHVSGGRRGSRATNGRSFFNANTIRSFYQTDPVDELLSTNCMVDRSTDNVIKLSFNVSAIPDNESLEGAELRIYREAVKQSGPEGFLDNTTSPPSKHRVDIIEILAPSLPNKDPICRLIDTRLVDPTKTSWEVFDVSPLVAKWRKDPQRNHGIEVRFLKLNREPSHLKHVRLKRSAHTDSLKWEEEQPTLVTYSDDKKNKVKDKRTRRASKNHRKNRKRNRRRNICKRKPLYVDFDEVGWNDWIVAPPGYQAYYCHGDCPFVLAENLNSTNHAIVQNLVNSVDEAAVPKPCCVPTELSAISMLYLDQDEKVTLKNYQDMVVEACGCR